MNKTIQIIINGKRFKVKENQTIYEIAKEKRIDVPVLCLHPDLDIKASCRVCAVEMKGKKDLVASCSTRVKPGMEIITDSPNVKKARKINLELLFAQHREECFDCIWRFNCQLLKLAEKYKVKIDRFIDRKTKYPIYQFKNAVVFDSTKCIDCRNCVEVCRKQSVNFLEIENWGTFFQVKPSEKPNRDCVYCGQCIIHCPVGAFEGVGEFEDIEKPLKEKDKIVVAQFAPSIRTSLGEEFGLPYGEVVTGKIVAALKKLGFNKVFDTSVGADFTTSEESKEVIERVKSKSRLPILTSCCPAWVKYIEFFYPEFVPNLTTARSPQAMLGGLIKTYWAKKENIDPKKIFVVSIMPCVAKKYEIGREELRFDGMKPVDCVLTTRELARLIMKNKINFKKLKNQDLDSAFGEPSGAGVIYGATGGVMESAFRTTYEKLTGKKLKKIDFEQVRGMEGIKKAEVDLNGDCRKIAVVNGLGNAQKLIEEIKSNPSEKYTCIEVMACPGGCIGGGGQPMPSEPDIRNKRAAGLYKIDGKKKLRKAHDNPIVKKIYSEFLDKDEKITRKILHTSYHQKVKEEVKILENK